jgi:hypothetical protein
VILYALCGEGVGGRNFPAEVSVKQTGEEVRHGCFLSVVHTVCGLLAHRIDRADFLSLGVAIPAALPVGWDCGRGSFEAGVGGGDAAGEAPGGAV